MKKYISRSDVVFQPKHISREQLLEGYRAAVRRFYSMDRIRKRLSKSPVELWWNLPLNLAYAFSLRRFGFYPSQS